MRPPHPITPEFLLLAYRQGYFPMAVSRNWTGPLAWFHPDHRGTIPLTDFHIPRRLRDRLRSRRFIITTNRNFSGVLKGCALPRADEKDTWINADIVRAYTALHLQGCAHSIEAWLPRTETTNATSASVATPITSSLDPDLPGTLVGGIYGVHIGSAFMAESKFCRPDLGGTDASKVCLAHLLLHLRRRCFTLLDTQYWNEHLEQFGCIELTRAAYLKRLAAALETEISWQPFDPEANLSLLQP